MGVEFIFSVISTLSSLLSSLRSSGATLVEKEGNDIERDLDRLERLLRRIQAALRDAGEREIRDEYVKLWLKELKIVAYEAEDILDEWQYELLCLQIEESEEASSSLAYGKEMKRLEGYIPDGMAKKVKIVIEKFEEISKDRQALSLREDDGERRGSVWTGLLPTSHMVNESAIFGRDEDKQTILDFLLSDYTGRINPTSVMAIMGMGGVGKTTLAQLVYNDSRVRNHFDLRSWVYVSPDFDVMRITKEILESINPGKICADLTGLSAAQTALVEAVTEKKLFIVLDDVWNESPSKWEQFVEPLRAAEYVKIVMTTRNEAVALQSGVTDTHDLSCLSENVSSLLFEHYVYGGQLVDADSCLKRIGVQIIKKCAGLPLAIKSIGTVLSYKMDEDSWRHILESELLESDGKDEIFPALKVSYYSLPSVLKPCFLFCSLFPKGSLLFKEQIIYMWIAHGYIRSCGGRRAEDIGNEFIHELCKRSFLTKNNDWEQRESFTLPDLMHDWEQRESFTMHDLMHDLAKSISTYEICTIREENVVDTYTRVHHTYAENHGILDRLGQRSLIRIRTVITNAALYNRRIPDLHYRSNKCMYSSMRVLKCLGVRMCDLEHISNFIHLRYLELDLGEIKRLPESISLLYNLVALQLSSLGLMELSINFGKLINLRFLAINGLPIRNLPESLGRLSNLQYLSVSCCSKLEKFPTSIGRLTSLKKLSVHSCKRITQIPSSIGDLTNLQRVYFSGFGSKTLPESVNRLCNLKILELSCSGSPVALLLGFERLLSRSSLNFSVNGLHGRKQASYQITKYVKTQRLIESLQPVSDLVKFKINGYEGVGYAFSKNWPFITAIARHCHVKGDNFFTELGELPSLNSLSLVSITGAQSSQLNIPQLSIQDTRKVRFPSLEELELVDLNEWSGSVGKRDRDFPVLLSLKIESCHNLRRLDIIRCSFTKLELDLLHLQLLESLYIQECLQLNLLKGLQSLNSIRTLYILWCPLLKEFLYPVMPKLPLSVEIVACPSLENWCQIQQLKYMKDFSRKMLVTSGNWNIKRQSDQNIFVEHLIIRSHIEKSLKLDECLHNLTTVEVRNCWKLEALEGLSTFKWLRKLVLWDCPQLKLKIDGEENIPLPPNLQSLAVHGCHKILSLDLLAQDRLSFTELEVTDCKLLMCIVGLQGLTNLETLAIIQCHRLLLEPLHVVPECVVISGCPRLKGWCEMHSVEPLDDDTDYNACEGIEVELKGRLTLD